MIGLSEANSTWLKAAAFDRKNQAYLISHRNGLLLFVCAKYDASFRCDLKSTSLAGS